MTPETSQIKDWYISLFRSFENSLNGEKLREFHRLRREAIGRFGEMDFPDTHQEEWRFTDISPILRHNFAFPGATKTPLPSPDETGKFRFDGMKSHEVIFFNGAFVPGLSGGVRLPSGVVAGSLAQALKRDDPEIQKHVSRYARFDGDAFTALNTAFTIDGAYIHIPDDISVAHPVHLLFIAGTREETIIQPRNLIVAGRNSKVKVIEHYVSLNDGTYFTNVVTEIHAGENAHVDLTKVQAESLNAYHVSTTEASVDTGGNFVSHAVSLGSSIHRHNLNVTLKGEGSSTNLEGLYLLSGDQLSDTHSFIDHAAPRCTSQEHYKGILDGRSRGVFNGKIMVRKGAQQTNSYQENRNIILSADAKVDTKPQLEIFADDVKCSHGATVGQLSKESLFYLRSRGIGEKEARLILIYAFANDVLKDISTEEVRNGLEGILSGRFLGGREQDQPTD